VVLCHGLPSATPPAPDDPGYAGLARALAARGFAAMHFTFRGCRDAPGEFSIEGWCRDLGAVIDTVGDGRMLIIAGSSMGGAVAIAVAAERTEVAAVATFAAPASLDELLPDPRTFIHEARNRGMIRDAAFPPDPDAWAAEFAALAGEDAVAAIAPRPVLIVHGDADTDVPYVHAERLFAAARDPKELVRLPGAGHRLRLDPRTPEVLIDWLERSIERSMT
jgi:pimeloyl-ACP methyl ester carboxylesterase